MIDLPELLSVAYQSERVLSRRHARQGGMPEELALRQLLAQRAGASGLAALVARRRAEREAEAGRLALRQAQKQAALLRHHGKHDGAPSAWRAWFDGSAHPNPGRCGIGAVLHGPRGESIELSRLAGHGNSSEAEYMALIAVLEGAVNAGATTLTVFGDSQVVIDDVNGPDMQGAPSLAAYRLRARALIAALPAVVLRWIPRHKNALADALSQQAVRVM